MLMCLTDEERAAWVVLGLHEPHHDSNTYELMDDEALSRPTSYGEAGPSIRLPGGPVSVSETLPGRFQPNDRRQRSIAAMMRLGSA